MNLADAVQTLGYLFSDDAPPGCLRSADTDDDGRINLTDVVRVLGFLFDSGPAPASPYPDCGADATPDELTCESHSCE